MTTFNPYEYTETPAPVVSPDDNGEFPPTPFTLKLAYREKPCLMTVEQDHLVIEGESLREPILMQRHERYKLNSCFYYSGENLIIWHRPTRKEFTFRIEERGTADLKVSWLLAWKEGIPDNRTPEQHVRKISNKWLYGTPILWLFCNVYLVGRPLIYHGDSFSPWFMAVLIAFGMAALVSLILMLCRIKEGILLTGVSLFAVYIAIMISIFFREYDDFLFGNGSLVLLLTYLTWRCCIMRYVRASRLQRQIRENPGEY